jgi:O-antigen ligase
MTVDFKFFNQALNKLRESHQLWLQFASLSVITLAIASVIATQLITLSTLEPLYRSSISALIFITVFTITLSNVRWGAMLCAFSLPFLPSLTFQILIFTGYGRILSQYNAGLDLTVAFVLASVVVSLRNSKTNWSKFLMPTPGCWVLVAITFSTLLGIARNLGQSESPFSWIAVFYNLSHLRDIGWHDDYRPLVDWASYSIAFALFSTLIPQLRSVQDRNDVIFKPLIIGVLLAALIGLMQNRTGIGLTEAQMLFRSDKGGFTAIGFQPDIHAFAGQLMMGAIGLLGYLYNKKNLALNVFVIGVLSPFALYVMYLSKSKSNLVLSLIFLVVVALLWGFRRSTHLQNTLFSIGGALLLLVISLLVFDSFWITQFNKLIHALGFADFTEFNFRVAYRPEIFAAALRMFLQFPILGLGQGEFYRLSAVPDFSLSPFLSTHLNGENAHNYFLQTLTELGILGFTLLTLFVAYPLWKMQGAEAKKKLIPAYVLLGSIFLANVYSHSMLVRENLLIASMVMALLYAWLAPEKIEARSCAQQTDTLNNQRVVYSNRFKLSLLLGFILIALSIHEIYKSFTQPPFLKDVQCFKEKPLERDGWTTGRYLLKMPNGSTGLTLYLATTQPDVVKRPLPGSLAIWLDEQLISRQDFVLNQTGPQLLAIQLPIGKLATLDDYRVELTVQRCFVPKNFGMGGDARRLGLRIESVNWNY